MKIYQQEIAIRASFEYLNPFCADVNCSSNSRNNGDVSSNTNVNEEAEVNACPKHKTEDNRRSSFRTWTSPHFTDIESLVTAGFFYTGEDDIVRCFSCGIRFYQFHEGEDPLREHTRYMPTCRHAIQCLGQKTVDQIQRCHSKSDLPAHPHYESKERRVQSFQQFSSKGALKAHTPDKMAEAGFFFTGEENDSVQCFHCSGRLCHWDIGDEPWTEHARWFPHCKFVKDNRKHSEVSNTSLKQEEHVPDKTIKELENKGIDTKAALEAYYIYKERQPCKIPSRNDLLDIIDETTSSSDIFFFSPDSGLGHNRENSIAISSTFEGSFKKVVDKVKFNAILGLLQEFGQKRTKQVVKELMESLFTDKISELSRAAQEVKELVEKFFAVNSIESTRSVPVTNPVTSERNQNIRQRLRTPLDPRNDTSMNDRINVQLPLVRYHGNVREQCKIAGINDQLEHLRSSGCNPVVSFHTFRLRGDVINNLMMEISQMGDCDLAISLNVDGGDGEMKMMAINRFNNHIRTSGIEYVDLIPDHEYKVRILAADIHRNDVSTPAMIGIFSIVHLSEHGRDITYTAMNYEQGHSNQVTNRKHRTDVLLDTPFVIPGEEGSPTGIIETDIFQPVCEKVISEINNNPDNNPNHDTLSRSTVVHVERVPGNMDDMTRFTLLKQRPVIVCPADESERSTEFSRFHSFLPWQYNDVISAERLVKAGFYQESDRSKITCIECGFSVDVTSLTTDVLRQHKQCCPECSFARRTNHDVNSPNDGNLADGITHNGSDIEVDTKPNLDGYSANHNGSAIGAVSYNDTSSDYIRTRGSANQHDIRTNIPVSDGLRNQPIVEPQSTLIYTAQSSEYRDPSIRESTFRYWNNSNRYQDIGKLVDAGFYFTGNGDAVRCFSCDIGLADWKPHDDPWVEHARHSPLCSYLISNKGQEFINGVQEAWRRIYTPRHRRFVEVEERLRSFENSGWPSDYVRQTPEELAEAGFFYTGERDTVRCHYCDGGLRDWEPEDDPWVEHGRWFSFCKYVIEKKGIEFIRECATGNGSRPATNVPQINRNNLPTSYNVDAPIESSEEKWRKKGLENPMLTAAAISVREMGYSKETVEMAINKYIAKTGNRSFQATELMEIVFELEEQGEVLPSSSISDIKDEQHSEADCDDFSLDGHEEPFPFSPEALLKENEVMKKRFTCMSCKVKDRTNVFLPCGHRLMCDPCARQQTKCCHCDTPVTDTVKTFLC